MKEGEREGGEKTIFLLHAIGSQHYCLSIQLAPSFQPLCASDVVKGILFCESLCETTKSLGHLPSDRNLLCLATTGRKL